MKKITDFLEQLGLNEVEAVLYEELLRQGSTTVKKLAEAVRINRVTAHFTIENLIKKGLVSQIKQGARRQIAAESPDHLNYFLEEKIKNTQQLKKDFPNFLKKIHNEIPPLKTKAPEVEVKYYKGKHGVQLLYEDVLKANEIRAYVNAMEVAKVFPNNMNQFIHTHHKRKNMYIWEVLNRAPKVEEYTRRMVKDRYFYKFNPPTINLSVVDYLIYDGKVAIVDIREDPTGLIIINKDFYDNAKALFDFVWKMLPD